MADGVRSDLGCATKRVYFLIGNRPFFGLLIDCPHPKSLSLGERDFESCSLSNLAPFLILLPFSPREKGLGDEGSPYCVINETRLPPT
jgi:hypothetical protein